MRKHASHYNKLRMLAEHIPYRDIEIDIEALTEIGGGDYLIGVRRYGTVIYLYRQPTREWQSNYRYHMETWASTEWYAGNVAEGWLIALSDREVPKILDYWLYCHYAT